MDILFYGDSNTYGVDPETGKRYAVTDFMMDWRA